MVPIYFPKERQTYIQRLRLYAEIVSSAQSWVDPVKAFGTLVITALKSPNVADVIESDKTLHFLVDLETNEYL